MKKKYSPKEYPKYDNYDAIEVDSIKNIPVDYYGLMGVPVTFFCKCHTEKFIIEGKTEKPLLNGKNLFKRIFVRRKKEA